MTPGPRRSILPRPIAMECRQDYRQQGAHRKNRHLIPLTFQAWQNTLKILPGKFTPADRSQLDSLKGFYMKLHASRILSFAAVLSLGALCPAQTIVDTYVQNFDIMGPTGATPPPGWTVLEGNSGTTNATWTDATGIAANGPNSVATMALASVPLIVSAAPTATNNNGFNAQGNSVTDRVLATSPTGYSGSALDLVLPNASGSASNSLKVSYDIRRFTVATSGGVPTNNELPGYQLFFSVNGGAWVNVSNLNPTIAGPTGIIAPNTVGVTSVPLTTINLGVSWLNGQSIHLRWVDDNAMQTSPDQIIGLDNVVVSFATPTPGAISGPTISQVLNNYSYTPTAFPNSGIAQSALFVITGTGLAAAAQPAVLQNAMKGLSATLNGSSVQVTSGGVTVTPAIYYTSPTQMALVLPSNTPVGPAQITATCNGMTSATSTFQVVQSAFGFATYNASGAGLGAALNPVTFVPYSYTNAIPPGTTVVLYGSGLGADLARDTTYVTAAFPAQFEINNLAHIYVGGVGAPIQYQGSFSYPGLNQINVTIPFTSPTGCSVPVVGVTAAGMPTNFITLPIGNGVCSDPAFGINGNLLTQASVKTAYAQLFWQPPAQGNGNYAFSDFGSYRGSDMLSFLSFTPTFNRGAPAWPSPNGCVVSQSLFEPGFAPETELNGGNVTVSGPVGPPVALVQGFASLPPTFIPATGGSFTFQGSGGPDVGGYMANTVLPNPPWSWTNQSAAATVTRSSGLAVTWSGGVQNSYVVIAGGWTPAATPGAAAGAPNASGAPGTASANFTCVVPQAPDSSRCRPMC